MAGLNIYSVEMDRHNRYRPKTMKMKRKG